MELKEYVIDCRRLADAAAAHAYLKELFSFPEYYGANLDALYDCLTEVREDVCFRLQNTAALGRRGSALEVLLHHAAEENRYIHLHD